MKNILIVMVAVATLAAVGGMYFYTRSMTSLS